MCPLAESRFNFAGRLAGIAKLLGPTVAWFSVRFHLACTCRWHLLTVPSLFAAGAFGVLSGLTAKAGSGGWAASFEILNNRF